MSEALFMLRAAPDRPGLAAWAATHGILGRDGELGYALHSALTAAFGELAPRPFRLYERRPRRLGEPMADDPVLYAYSQQPVAALLEHARAYADPAVWQALGLDHLAGKPMPTTFAAGCDLGFEVRVRPVRRRDRENGTCERDVFLIACDRRRLGDGGRSGGCLCRLARREACREWCAPVRRLDAAMQSGHTAGWRLSGAHGSGDAIRAVGCAGSRGPTPFMAGQLRITDPDRFHALLARGVGRHRAFGFGMLLLRPA